MGLLGVSGGDGCGGARKMVKPEEDTLTKTAYISINKPPFIELSLPPLCIQQTQILTSLAIVISLCFASSVSNFSAG